MKQKDEMKKFRGEGKKMNIKRRIEHWQIIALYLVLYDIIAVNCSYFFGLWLRFDLKFTNIPPEFLRAFLKFAPVYTIMSLVIFYGLRLYKSLWRFASFSELNRIFAATIVTSLVQMFGMTIFVERMPISYYITGPIVQFFLLTAVRFSYRYVTLERSRRHQREHAIHNVMVIGAGAAGQTILKELKNSKELSTNPCCVIDDNPNKAGRFIEGVPVVGGRECILESVEKYKIDQILFAIPTASAKTKRDMLNICKETTCELKSLPGLYQLAKGEVSLSKMKAVAVEDLLGREPVKVNMEEIFRYIKGKRILVTGGGGSIGSELCRQIAGHEPEQLIIFDIYENNAYEIEQELRRKYGDKLNLVVLIGSVRDSRRINMVFEKYKPQLVYHAAAHKHVPLMETSPNEAIKNNAIGTYKTAYAALKHGAERFVLISTDKAVNPTNIMGASKRLCEMIIQSMDAISREGRMDLLPFLHAHVDKIIDGQVAHDPMDHMAVDEAIISKKAVDEVAASIHSNINVNTKLDAHSNIKIKSVENQKRKGTQFVAVRFGNVLGSNGSVIPLFKKQIEAGGPVTVTHPDIVRYFMTIPEAVSLVLQAGTYAWGGEIFVLDMGEQVKIADLATNLIRLSGLTPGEDIEIQYSGLRPGEKLFEERLMAEEGIRPTENEKIHIGKPIPFVVDTFLKQLEELAKASYENSDDIVEMVEEIVTTFHPVGKHNNNKNDVKSNNKQAAEGKKVKKVVQTTRVEKSSEPRGTKVASSKMNVNYLN